MSSCKNSIDYKLKKIEYYLKYINNIRIYITKKWLIIVVMTVEIN